MPTKPPPSEVLAALVTQRYPIPTEVWGDFWDRLGAKALHPGEALAVLSSLTTQTIGSALVIVAEPIQLSDSKVSAGW